MMSQNIGDGLFTTPSHIYAQSKYHCALCINYHINNYNRNRVLLYYLFQENKSFGSKKPFAFILWCTESCVKHSMCAISSVGVCVCGGHGCVNIRQLSEGWDVYICTDIQVYVHDWLVENGCVYIRISVYVTGI
jgi:hypothetical protein